MQSLANNPVRHSCLLIIDILGKAVWSAALQSSAELKNPLQTTFLHFKVTVKLSRLGIPHSKFLFTLAQGILILSTSSRIHILNYILQFSGFSNLKIPKCFSDGGEVSLRRVLWAQLFPLCIQRKWAMKTDGLLKVAHSAGSKNRTCTSCLPLLCFNYKAAIRLSTSSCDWETFIVSVELEEFWAN